MDGLIAILGHGGLRCTWARVLRDYKAKSRLFKLAQLIDVMMKERNISHSFFDISKPLTLFFVDQNGVARTLVSEIGLISFESALGSSHGATSGLVRVSTALQVELAGQVSALRLGRGLEAEGRGRRRHIGRVL